MLDLKNIDKSWTLFLDRDGVINHEKHKDYIHKWDEFRFYDGVQEAVKIFAAVFNRIVVITNQKGVGKGLTKLDDLHEIHSRMKQEIENHGGRIDAIFYCSDLDETSLYRKPNPGMGFKAAEQFPEINLQKTIMVGNTMSDMEFGKTLGTHTVFLPTTRPDIDVTSNKIDLVYDSLLAFARELQAQ